MRKLLTWAALGLALFTFTACGGGGDNDDAAPGDRNGNGDVASNLPPQSADPKDMCEALRNVNFNQGGSPTTLSRDQMREAAQQVNFDRLIETAPDEIKADMTLYVDSVLRPLYNELERVDFDYQKVNPAVFQEAFAKPELVQAGQRISEFYIRECGITPTTVAGN